MINWRELLTDAGIEWRDRGRNVSSGNIVIACPMCEDDPGEHLLISEVKEAYFCLRNPDHAGKNINRLLVKLGFDYNNLAYILNKYNSDTVVKPKPKPPVSESVRQWEKFLPASENPRCLTYLASRGFATPVGTTKLYDLRFARAGKWAGRLLIPIREGGSLKSWTGRSVLPSLPVKYLTESNDQEHLLYIPRTVRGTLVLVEGPLDALKIVSATNQSVCSAAFLGKNYFKKLPTIVKMSEHCEKIFVALDSDVPFTILNKIVDELCYGALRVSCPVDVLPLPRSRKDAAELSNDEIQKWIG